MIKNKIGDYLKENGIKPSLQRLKVYEYLANHKNHPNVDTIYQELVKEIPTLSKTTVYNTLNLFIEKGIVRIVTIEDNEVKYDADISLHGHFKCVSCGEIYDFDISIPQDKEESLNGFKVDEKHVYYKGKCKKCL